MKKPPLTDWLVTVFALLVLLSQSTAAATLETPESEPEQLIVLKPFEATYSGKYNGFSITAIRKLQQTASDDHWVLSNHITAFLGQITEQSTFTLQNNQLFTQSYTYDRKVFGKSRALHMSFDHETEQVTISGEKTASIPLLPTLLDKLGYQILLQHHIQHEAETLSYQVVDKDRVKNYNFAVTRHETLEVAGKPTPTIVVERLRENSKRKTLMWFAPSMDYLLVRLEQEEDGREYLLELETVAH